MNYDDEDDSSLSSYTFDDRSGSQVVESPTFTVTDLLTSLGERTQEPDYLVTKGNDLVLLLRQYSYMKEDLIFSAFGHILQTLLIHSKKEVVATGYRICRHVIHDHVSIQSLISLKLDVMIIISLSKSLMFDIEREQALKLVRSFLDVPNGAKEITKGIVNAILSVAEQVDETLRKISVETICEISLMRPDLVPPQSLLQFIVDGPHDLSLLATSVFLTLLNEPEGRSKVEVVDVLKLISPFTEFPVKGHLNNEKLQNNSLVISKCLKNLTGLHLFCLNSSEPLKDLLACLTYPIDSVVSKLLDLLLDVLLINPLSKKTNSKNQILLVPYKSETEFILNTQYLTLLLAILLKCDVIDHLLYVMKRSNDDGNCTKAAFLLTEIFNLSINLIPEELTSGYMNKIQRLGCEEYPNFEESKKAIFMIEKLSRKSYKGRSNIALQSLKNNDSYSEAPKVLIQKANYFIDEAKLKQMIQDSKVLSTKNFSKWNCDIISDLFQGPFMSGKRLDEVNRTSKFLKRLLSFYRPFKRKFSNTRKTKHSQRFTRVGCEIIETLLASSEGKKLLKESKILPQIAECLAQLDPYSGFYATDQIFSKERLETTLSDGYMKMLGVLSNDEYGVQLLENWKIFTILHHINDASKRNDLLILVLDEFKFNKQGHSRILLSKLLHSRDRALKLHATDLLSTLIHYNSCTSFVCGYVVEQLYEQDEEICAKVVKILLDYCDESPDNLNQIIDLSPSITLLRLSGEDGEALVMKFLSTSEGFEYLNEQGLIEEEVYNWTHGLKYLNYSIDIEKQLLNLDRESERESSKGKELPSNFFGELVKTEEGFNVIVRSGIMTDFINTLRYYSTSLDKNEVIEIDYLKLKASLWSIGFISTSQLGVEALDVNGSIEDIIKIAVSSPLFDVKGCAFYVLGLISKTYEGIEILDEFGWSSKLDIYNNPIGIVVPQEIDVLMGAKEAYLEDKIEEDNLLDEIDPSDKALRKLMKLVGNLCNLSSLNSSTKELTSLSKVHPECFEDPDVFFVVLEYFERYKYRLTIRKFIIELFVGNRVLLDVLVKRDKRRIKELLHH